jgi:hydroxypyruvate isomerase
MRRREFVATWAAAGASAGLAAAQSSPAAARAALKGRIKQGCMRPNFGEMEFEDMCREASRLGIYGFDIIDPNDWPTLKKYGMNCLMATTGGVTFEQGLIHPEIHADLEKGVREMLDLCAANDVPNMITVGGQRNGMSYEEGADHCVAFLNRVKAHAEDKGVTICIEVMNSIYQDSRIGRFDQLCDHFPWAVEVVKRVNSPRVKVLFDIYHVQIMDGNVATLIRENIDWIGHFHTGGVPGRHEINGTQELNYPFLAQVIVDTGFDGYVTHEYRLSEGHDAVETLAEAIRIMDV